MSHSNRVTTLSNNNQVVHMDVSGHNSVFLAGFTSDDESNYYPDVEFIERFHDSMHIHEAPQVGHESSNYNYRSLSDPFGTAFPGISPVVPSSGNLRGNFDYDVDNRLAAEFRSLNTTTNADVPNSRNPRNQRNQRNPHDSVSFVQSQNSHSHSRAYKWTPDLDRRLQGLIGIHGNNWAEIAKVLRSSPNAVMARDEYLRNHPGWCANTRTWTSNA